MGRNLFGGSRRRSRGVKRKRLRRGDLPLVCLGRGDSISACSSGLLKPSRFTSLPLNIHYQRSFMYTGNYTMFIHVQYKIRKGNPPKNSTLCLYRRESLTVNHHTQTQNVQTKYYPWARSPSPAPQSAPGTSSYSAPAPSNFA